MTRPGLSLEERLWKKIDRRGADECWPWTASTRKGYGQIRVASGGPVVDAHLLVYEMCVGPLIDGMEIDHVCHTVDCQLPWGECPHRRCCNPAHLVQRTHRENVLRGKSPSAACASVTHCPEGHPYDVENTYRTSGGRRQCRACWPEKNRRKRRGNPEVWSGQGAP